jgi:hypothetical protein
MRSLRERPSTGAIGQFRSVGVVVEIARKQTFDAMTAGNAVLNGQSM